MSQEKTIIREVIDDVEKVFRYLLPGIIFIMLFKLFFPINFAKLIKDTNVYEKSAYLPALGMIIYAFHRVIWTVIFDALYYKFQFKDIANLYKQIYTPENKELRGYIYYKFGIVHFGLISSELLFFFSILSLIYPQECFLTFITGHKLLILFVATIFFGFSVFNYYIMHKVQGYLLNIVPLSWCEIFKKAVKKIFYRDGFSHK